MLPDLKDFKATLVNPGNPASQVPWVPGVLQAPLESLVMMVKLESLENLVKEALPALRVLAASQEPQDFLVSKVTEATPAWMVLRAKLVLRV